MPTTRGGKNSCGHQIELVANTNVVGMSANSEGDDDAPPGLTSAAVTASGHSQLPASVVLPAEATDTAAAAAAAAAATGSADHLNAAGASNINYNNHFMHSAMPYGNPFLGHNLPQFQYGIITLIFF